MKNNFDLNEKVVLITGAMGQIGSEITKSFLKQGALVAVTDLHIEKSDNFLNFIKSNSIENSRFDFFQIDIRSDQSCDDGLIEIIKKFGKIDVLINNAAIDAKFDNSLNQTHLSRFENFPIQKVIDSVEVNLTGTIRITQKVCKIMLKQKAGNIINVASTYSLVSPNQNLYDFGSKNRQYKPVDYVASKSFIPNFTRYLATFYSRDGIRVNAIVPHGIFNNHSQNFLKNWEKLSPIGRMCNVDELNGPFIFLASDASSYMTGSTLIYDGGWTAW